MLNPLKYNKCLTSFRDGSEINKLGGCDDKVRENAFVRSPERDVFVTAFSAKLSVIDRQNKFSDVAMTPQNPKWLKAVSRLNNTRMPVFWGSEFSIDKNIIMNSDGYDRLRYKTMVYPIPQNDMITTRSTHVAQVANIAETISNRLGLNSELAQAIAYGHDIGHAPFGHDGERALKTIIKEYGLPVFWHEKNGVRMVDKLLTRIDENGTNVNLNLTYAVRDGIISHCGEVDENFIKPRNEYINLDDISLPAQYQPYTWEGVVVKISDKIAYLGRDIEDALRLGIYNKNNLSELESIVKNIKPDFDGSINNHSLLKMFIDDIVKNSNPQIGIGFSQEVSLVMDSIKKYNSKNIYTRDDVRLVSQSQTNNILMTLFKHFDSLYNGALTVTCIDTKKSSQDIHFKDWLVKYTDNQLKQQNCKNDVVYNLNNRQDYRQAILDYISGMTDSFAIKSYNCLLNQL